MTTSTPTTKILAIGTINPGVTGPPHELRADSYWPAQSALSVAGHESKPLAWQSGDPCGSLEPGQKRRMKVRSRRLSILLRNCELRRSAVAYETDEGSKSRRRSNCRNQCEDTDWIGLCWSILGAAIGALGRDNALMARVEHQFPGRSLVFHSLISQL